MTDLNEEARQARITAYKSDLEQKLKPKLIDTKKKKFSDLVNDRGRPVESLNGQIILGRDLTEDGKLKGVMSAGLDDLAAILPDIKVDVNNKTGWKKHLDRWKSEGIDILEGVADPMPDEYELSVAEELVSLDVATMSDAIAKAKLLELQQKQTKE